MNYFLRYWGNISFYGILILALVFFVFSISDALFVYATIPFVAIAIWGYMRNQKILKDIITKFGKVRVQFTHATPIDTMLASAIQCGYKITDIAKMSLVSGDLATSCEYLTTSKTMKTLIEKNPEISIDIIGFCDENFDSIQCNNINFYQIAQKYNSHKNILTMKDGKKFLWYEANHQQKNGKDIFIDGVYFIELTDAKAKELETEYESLKAG